MISIIILVQYSSPIVGLVSRPVSAPLRDAKLPADRRPGDKYSNVKGSGYGQRSLPSKMTASKSAYSPSIKHRTGLKNVVLGLL